MKNLLKINVTMSLITRGTYMNFKEENPSHTALRF
jgi:hypothetical protein